jgi:DNA-binding XRE family transcriptional regulator
MVMFAYAGKEEVVYHSKGGRPSGQIKTACPILRELFEIAKEKGLTQFAVAEGVKVWPKTVNDWYNGRSVPDIFVYREIAKFLGVQFRIEK